MLCSEECRVIGRKAAMKRHILKRPTTEKQIGKCKLCFAEFVMKKSGTVYCSDLCRSRSRQEKLRARTEQFRKCMKCGIDVPVRAGYPICANCKIDKRDAIKARRKEELRRYRKYGITEQEYFDLFNQQNNCCAICFSNEATKKGWQIDHCHVTGKVRGILCHHCNTAIGQFKDDPNLLISAIRYLELHNK